MSAVSAFGWYDTGHMVIAQIAWDHMTPQARAEAEKLVKIAGTPETSDFLTASCWADDIKHDRRDTAPWHFIDLHFRADGKPTTNKPDAENVVWAIEKFKPILADPAKPDADRAEALRFLIHFIGDIHQPLHATARDTDALPEGDAGGNKFHIQPPARLANEDRPPHNLHALWDEGCGLLPGLGRGARPLSPQGLDEIKTLAQKIERDRPEASLPNSTDLKPMDWAIESAEAARTVVYDLPEDSAPSDSYIEKGQALTETRIALAGYRLAEVLNELLK